MYNIMSSFILEVPFQYPVSVSAYCYVHDIIFGILSLLQGSGNTGEEEGQVSCS